MPGWSSASNTLVKVLIFVQPTKPFLFAAGGWDILMEAIQTFGNKKYKPCIEIWIWFGSIIGQRIALEE